MRRLRRVKIVATMGPASSSPEMVAKLFEAGVDVFRINMSHTAHEHAKKLHSTLRAAEVHFSRPIGILCDLQGPKFRLGAFADERVAIAQGGTFEFTREQIAGTAERVHLPHGAIFEAVEAGHRLLIDDGKLIMDVTGNTGGVISAVARNAGTLASRKGIAMPDSLLPINPLTEKDRADLDYCLKLGVDWVALSFVQRGEDIAPVREACGREASIMAKIEKPQAITNLDAIVQAVDGLMVARGDLGVEMPIERVPGLQKEITRRARAAGKPVIVATQMLESMISSPTPTRAEVSDVATAVFDGADAIMLSAESAVGSYPVEAVDMMSRIVTEAEADTGYDALVHATRTPPQATAPDAIAAAAHAVADTLKLAAIICYTATGSTALRVARERPGLPVIAVTPVLSTGRRLSMVWGMHCVLTSDPENLADVVRKGCRIAFDEGFAKPRDGILIVAGVPLGSPGTTNMLRIAYVSETGEPMPGQL